MPSFSASCGYKQVELISSLSINVSEIAVQLAAEHQIRVDNRTMFSEVLLVLPTPDTDRAFFGIRNNYTRDVVISLQFIPKIVATIVDIFTKDR